MIAPNNMVSRICDCSRLALTPSPWPSARASEPATKHAWCCLTSVLDKACLYKMAHVCAKQTGQPIV